MLEVLRGGCNGRTSKAEIGIINKGEILVMYKSILRNST